jgi:hypothetical protein
MRKKPWPMSKPVSLLFHRGIMIERRLKNWCRKARFRPGFV